MGLSRQLIGTVNSMSTSLRSWQLLLIIPIHVLPPQHAVYTRLIWNSTLWQAMLVLLISVQALIAVPLCSNQDVLAVYNSLVTTFICLTVRILRQIIQSFYLAYQ
jgi:hypothetical protein